MAQAQPASQEDDGIPHLAARLEHLFQTVPRRDGTRKYSNARAADELTASGVAVTGHYLRMLRNGERTNPSAKLLHALSVLFEVPMDYFFDDQVAARTDSQMETISAVRMRRARMVSSGVAPDEIADLEQLLGELRS